MPNNRVTLPPAGTDTALALPRLLENPAPPARLGNVGMATDVGASHVQLCLVTGRPVPFICNVIDICTVSRLNTVILRTWPCIGPPPVMFVPAVPVVPAGSRHETVFTTWAEPTSKLNHCNRTVANGLVLPALAVRFTIMSYD